MATCPRPRPTTWWCPECKTVIRTKRHRRGWPIPTCDGVNFRAAGFQTVVRIGEGPHQACEMRGL